MFAITRGKGFHIKFENGWTVSVQFGGGNYCDNYNLPIGRDNPDPIGPSRNAEIAYWPEGGDLQKFPDGDTVKGHVTPKEVLALMVEVAAK